MHLCLLFVRDINIYNLNLYYYIISCDNKREIVNYDFIVIQVDNTAVRVRYIVGYSRRKYAHAHRPIAIQYRRAFLKRLHPRT